VRLIGYIRVSRVAGREGPSFIAPEIQRERIQAMAAARGDTVVDWEQDLDQPGSKLARPGFQAALEAVESGVADGVIVAKLDRFGRSLRDALESIERLQAADGQLISVAEQFDTSQPIGKAVVRILLVLAELELDHIRENWATAGSHAAARGVHVCKVAPVGYQKASDGRLEPDPSAAPVIRDVFRRRGAGASWNELCTFLDDRLPRENGGAWARSSVTSLIERRTYLGEARGGGVVNPDAHAPIITRAEFEAAQVAQADGRRDRNGEGALLAGILRCEGCGNVLTRISNGSRGYHNYKCRKRSGKGVCEAPASISVRRADDYVEREFLGSLERPLVAKGKPADKSIEQAVATLEAAEAELSEYQAANLISVIGRDEFVRQVGKRQEAVDAARRALGGASMASPLEGVRDLAALWPELEVRQRRHLLGSALDHVVVTAAPGAGRGAAVADRLRLVWK
jgi:DNA invertase Pin-like site-specific DNA recombinase